MIPERRRQQLRPAIKYERTTFPHLVQLIGKVSFGFCESDVQLSLLTLPPRSQEVGDIRFLPPARSPRPDWIQARNPADSSRCFCFCCSSGRSRKCLRGNETLKNLGFCFCSCRPAKFNIHLTFSSSEGSWLLEVAKVEICIQTQTVPIPAPNPDPPNPKPAPALYCK